MTPPKVYVVIVNYNNWKDTIECLESLFHSDYKNFYVVVCDNNSTDSSFENIIAWAEGNKKISNTTSNSLNYLTSPEIKKPLNYFISQKDNRSNYRKSQLSIIPTESNLGFAGGNNIGIRYAMANNCDYIWLLNNDTVVAPDCLTQMVRHSQSMPNPNTCGSVLYFYHQPEIIQALGGNSYNKWTGLASTSLGRGLKIFEDIDHSAYQKKLSYISGASWLVPKQFIDDIGLMEEDYFLYCEEIDWCVRNQGRYQLTYAPKASVYHKEGGSIGSPSMDKPSSLFSDYFIFRNKLKFTQRFFPEAILSTYLVSLLQAFNRARRGQWDKARLILKILFGCKIKDIGVKLPN